MTKNELLHELDRIIDVGIVNAHHDKEVLQAVREQLTETDLAAFKRILSGCKSSTDTGTCTRTKPKAERNSSTSRSGISPIR